MHERIPVALLFAMNQDLVPGCDLATDVCYLPLLEVFEAHPGIRFNLEISGTLFDWAAWHRPRLLDTIRRMHGSGQLELVASTFSRNILYCSQAATVADSIRFHMDLLAKNLGAHPRGFLNPGKVWSHEYIPQIAGAGLEWTLVDERVLRGSGIHKKVNCPRRGVSDGQEITILTDSLAGTAGFHDAVAHFSLSRYEALVQYLAELRNESPDGLFTYCEHAERSGLWQYLEQDGDPKTIIKHWDRMLTQLERDERLETVCITTWLHRTKVHERLETSVDGEPEWIAEVFAIPGTRWNEGGFRDWFDFAEHSSEMRYFREFYAELAGRIANAASALATTRLPAELRMACERLIDDARFGLVLHQYELGFSEQDVRGFSRRELARVISVRLALVDAILADRTGFSISDVNDDGLPEILWLDAGNFYVFSKMGGRLLYWFDLLSAREMIGCEHVSHYEELFRDDNHVVPEVGIGDGLWTNLEQRPQESVETGRYLLRRRGLLDTVVHRVSGESDGTVVNLAHHEMPFALKQERIEFQYEAEGLALLKILAIREDGLDVTWHVALPGDDSAEVAIVSETAFSPQHEDVLREGLPRDWYQCSGRSVTTPMFEVGLIADGAKNVSSVEQAFAVGFIAEYSGQTEDVFTAECRLFKKRLTAGA
ncbi:MAG TPA: hypothetical protein PLM00_00055 [Spirochaetota bacterium]|nr:hypothetical protein [Spirochaetota bacterium]HPH01344.1 hypothetical protein [Spirochaetota bacterium]HPN81753.1 hypothetical protein [Spirochaetota bacterium]